MKILIETRIISKISDKKESPKVKSKIEDIVQYNNIDNSFIKLETDKTQLTVKEIKTMCKNYYDDLPPKVEILEEILYKGIVEYEDENEVITKFNGLEYNMIIKG